MNINHFVLQIAFLVLPGVVTIKIYRKLRGNTIKKDWEDFFDIFVFSIICYLIYGFLSSINITLEPFNFQLSYLPVSTFESFSSVNFSTTWDEVFYTTLIGVVLAFISSLIYKHKVINRIGQIIKVTKRYGDEDVWDYFNNLPEVEWVVVRDHKLKLYYFCWIKIFSETKEKRELLLGDVSVYNEDGEFCYFSDAIYIARDFYDLTIEIPNLDNTNKKNKIEEVIYNEGKEDTK